MNNTVRRLGDPAAKRCAFTGYRPQTKPFGFDEADPRCVDFKGRLANTIQMLIDKGYKHFISDGAMGFDMYAAEAVVDFRKNNPEIILEMVSPYDAHASEWPPDLQARYDKLFALADIITATGHEFTKGVFFARNRYLVANADVLLAAFDDKPGGKAMTCDLARTYNIPIIEMKPSLI